MLSTIAGAPKIRIMPPMTLAAICQEIRPNIHANPRKTTAMIAMIRAHVLVRRSWSAVRKFVPESNRAAAWASCGRRVIPISTTIVSDLVILLFIVFLTVGCEPTVWRVKTDFQDKLSFCLHFKITWCDFQKIHNHWLCTERGYYR